MPTAPSSQAEDLAAILAVVATQQTGFNTKDAELFAAPWRERSWSVSAFGRELAGRDAVLDAARRAGRVRRFEPARPTLAELFREVVEQ